jgi:hypothetical protein
MDVRPGTQKEKPSFQAIPNCGRHRACHRLAWLAKNCSTIGVKTVYVAAHKLHEPAILMRSWPDCVVAFIDHSSEVWNFQPDSPLFAVAKTQEKGEAMKRTMMALAAAATLAVSALAAPAPAHAQRGVAAGVVGGLIGGAIIGGAIANSPGYYGPGYGYYGGPAYVAGPGYDGYEGCYWQRQRFWDGYGWRIRRVRVCG